jgi:hypothetical protein
MRVLPWVAVVTGCGAALHDDAAFRSEFAQRWCERQQECALGEFDRHYSSFDDCWTHVQDDPGIHNWDRGCPLDPVGAGDCLDYLSTTDCAGWEGKEIDHACEDAYPC